ncbi:MAG TPA: hypothetical protein VIG64_12165 [Actinomycetota bacterium]
MKAEWDVRFRGFVMDRDENAFHVPPPEELEQFMDEFGKELDSLGAEDVLIETTMSKGYVDLSLSVAALQFEEAVAVGSSLIRTAFHTAGAATPDWSVDWIEVKAQRADDPGADSGTQSGRELVGA